MVFMIFTLKSIDETGFFCYTVGKISFVKLIHFNLTRHTTKVETKTKINTDLKAADTGS